MRSLDLRSVEYNGQAIVNKVLVVFFVNTNQFLSYRQLITDL